jgi:hypothetical protein
MCCGNKDNGGDLVEGNRYDVIYVHPSRGKKIVTGMKTKERLGFLMCTKLTLPPNRTCSLARHALNRFRCKARNRGVIRATRYRNL